MVKKVIFILCVILLSPLAMAQISYQELHTRLGSDELLFISAADMDTIFVTAAETPRLRKYHNQYLREPLYDDYLHPILINMLGFEGFQHLFRNLGGGFVPLKVEQDYLWIRGTRDHCGGMEEALVVVDLDSGDITSMLYSEESFLIHSTYQTPTQLPKRALNWIKRLLDAYGTRHNPTRNKQLLRKMAGDWCRSDSP